MNMKKVFVFIGITFLGIFLALLLIPIIYKQEILNKVKDSLNANLNAIVDFKDVDLSLIRSFPNARLTIHDLQISGIDTFENIDLLKAKNVFLITDITPLFKKSVKPSIKFITISGADINILKLSENYANYLITKETEDTSSFNLVLEGYELSDSKITYQDKSLFMIMKVKGVNHSGKGNLSNTIFELDTKTTIDSLYLNYNGFTYLNDIPASSNIKIGVDLPNEKYSFENGEITLNKLVLKGNGKIDFENDDILLSTKMKSLGQSFENFVSALPFIENKKEYSAKGIADISFFADGVYNGEIDIYPKFNINAKIKDGYLKYKQLEYPVSPINFKMSVISNDNKLKDLSINIPHFDFGINKEKIEGNLNIDRASTQPALKGRVNGNINLKNWKKSVPLEGVSELSGTILTDLQFNGNLSDIESKTYEKIGFDGHFTLNNIVYNKKDNPKISAIKVQIEANPRFITLQSESLKIGKSNISLSGSISDPLQFALKDGSLNGNIKLNSELIDFDEFNSVANSNTTNQEGPGFDPNKYKTGNIKLDLDVKKIIFGQKIYENIKAAGKIGLNVMDIENLAMTFEKSDIAIDGKISNAYDYLMANEKLSGHINLNSNYLNLNQFMTFEKDETEKGVILIPSNLAIDITSNIKKLDYTSYTLSNLTGHVVVANQEAKLENINTEILGGTIHFDGLYNTAENKPNYSIKLALDKIRIEDAYKTFVSMQTLAPISQYIKGFLNTTLIMSGSITENMTPEWSDVNADGFIETIHSAIQNLAIFDQIADKLGIEALKKIDLSSSKNWFNIIDGTVELKEKAFTSQDIGMKISGKHKIKGDMDYDLFIKVPRTKIKKSGIGGQLDKGFSWIANEAQKKGVAINDGEFIDIKVDIKGKLVKPDLHFTLLGSSGKSMAEQMTEEIKFQIDKATDSIKQVITDKKKSLEDTVRTRLESELEKQKEKLKNEAEKKTDEALSTVKKEIQKELEARVDSTVAGMISDSLKKKTEEIIKSKTGGEVKEIKKKLEEFNPFKKKKKSEGG